LVLYIMASDNLDEYRAKLQKSKQQLKKVKQLLTQQPNNENLLNLKKDLEEVVSVTESLILKKQEKAFDPQKVKKPSKPSTLHSDPSPTNALHQDSHRPNDASNSNIYANNPMFVQTQGAAAKPEKPKRPIPREWGIKKDHYEIDERCQVKWNRKWYIAKVMERVEAERSAESKEDDEDDGMKYRVWFLNHGQEYVASLEHIRSYVPPLVSQLRIGMRVRALWSKDGRFYPALIEEIADDGEYRIKFEKYNEYWKVPLYDIQLFANKDPVAHSNVVRKGKDGTLHIAESVTIPQALWSRDDDTPAEREKKRKKIRSIKRQHRSLKMEVESKNRANSWTNFKAKSLKKSRRKFQSTLLRQDQQRSIFENPSNATSSMMEKNANMTTFSKRTHFHHLKRDPKQYKEGQ